MSTIDTAADLARFGDELQAATQRNLDASRRRGLAGRIGLAVAALTVITAGSAVAAGLFTPHQVATGMPAGTMMFGGTHPSCALDGDGITYHCTLASAPSGGLSDYAGSKELVAIDQKIAGGCIGQDQAGLTWDCWMGEDAVRHDILVQDLLGQPELEPSKG